MERDRERERECVCVCDLDLDVDMGFGRGDARGDAMRWVGGGARGKEQEWL